MQVHRIHGRKYTDPDLVALIDSCDNELDPYAFVDACAAALLERFAAFDGACYSALERVRAIASLAGFEVRQMDEARSKREERDAVLVPTQSGARRGLILYNPWKIEPRIVHSIAHEITHSFFPNSYAGAQFRAIHRQGNGPVPDLEQLCDYGAAALTMPFSEVQRAVRNTGISLDAVNRVRRRFGTSFEATLYRIATTATEPVAAALFCFRNPKNSDSRRRQLGLFPSESANDESLEKYRRQSFHHSPSYPKRLIFPWNKLNRTGFLGGPIP